MSPIKHKPTPETIKQVETLSGLGMPQPDIAREIGISHETLRKYYREAIDSGVAKANANVAKSLYQKAVGNGPQSAVSAMFWLKTRARWRETIGIDQTITTTAAADLTGEELERRTADLLDRIENLVRGDERAPPGADKSPDLHKLN